MHTAKLRTVGGSTMVAIPPALLEALKLAPQAEVTLEVQDDRLVIVPVFKRRGRIGLAARLALCDPNAPEPPEVREWMNAPRVGREEI